MYEKDYDSYIGVKVESGKKNISVICAIAFLYFTRYSFLSFATTFSISTALVGGSMMILFLALLFYYTLSNPSRIPWDGVLIVFLILLFFQITILIHPEYQYRFDDAYHDGRFSAQKIFQFGAGLYTYFLIRLFRRSKGKLYKLFSVIAYVILFFDIWVAFIGRSEEYSMSFGYQMALAAIIFLARYLEESKQKIHLLLSLFCIGMGVLYGSRACVITYVLFAVVYMLWKGKFEWKHLLIGALGLMAAISINSTAIMKIVYKAAASIGFQSRTLYMLSVGDIMGTDSSRQVRLWPVLIEQLKNMPFYKGMWAYGDRTLFPTYYGYCHNFILEILVTFGILVGGAFLLWMFIGFIRTIRHNKDTNGLMTVVFGCFALAKLSFSNTFWQEPYFWTFIAMLVNCAAQRRKEKKTMIIRIPKRAIQELGGQTAL